MPFLVPLSGYANVLAHEDVPLDEFIKDYFRSLGAPVTIGGFLQEALRSGKAVILLDGLDEVKETGLRHTNLGTSLFVWAVWARMLVAALVFVRTYGSNVPSWDEWDMVPTLTGEQPVTLATVATGSGEPECGGWTRQPGA